MSTILSKAKDLILVTQYQGQPLTWLALAEALGVTIEADGSINGPAFFNACLHCQDNPQVAALPSQLRIQVIYSASLAMTNLQSGNVN